MSDKCKWIARPGTGDSYFAYTPCKPGFNYLGGSNWDAQSIKRYYNHKICPICGKSIEINTELLEDAHEEV